MKEDKNMKEYHLYLYRICIIELYIDRDNVQISMALSHNDSIQEVSFYQ